MRRREFIVGLGGAATAWPTVVMAQSADRRRRIGLLMPYAQTDAEATARVDLLTQTLQDLGWTDGQNVRIDTAWAGGDARQMSEAANRLVTGKSEIVLADSAQAVLAIQLVKRTMAIVFVNLPDPVDIGIATSIAHPGGNVTGFTNFENSISSKWLELLTEISPANRRIGVLYLPENPNWRSRLAVLDAAARALSVELFPTGVRDTGELEAAFHQFAHKKIGGCIVLPAPFMTVHRERITSIASQQSIATVYYYRHFVTIGGLMSFGAQIADIYRRAPNYIDQILRGSKPGDLPIQYPTKFELVINLKTAKALGLEVPPMLLARADEVIE